MRGTVTVLSIELRRRDSDSAVYDVTLQRVDAPRKTYQFVVLISHTQAPGHRFLSCHYPTDAAVDFDEYQPQQDGPVSFIPCLARVAGLAIQADIAAVEGGAAVVLPAVVYPVVEVRAIDILERVGESVRLRVMVQHSDGFNYSYVFAVDSQGRATLEEAPEYARAEIAAYDELDGTNRVLDRVRDLVVRTHRVAMGQGTAPRLPMLVHPQSEWEKTR
jgi:hypothetical protein